MSPEEYKQYLDAAYNTDVGDLSLDLMKSLYWCATLAYSIGWDVNKTIKELEKYPKYDNKQAGLLLKNAIYSRMKSGALQ